MASVAEGSTRPRVSETPPRTWPGWLVLFLLAVALYAATAARGAQWQDFGLHILRIYTGELSHPLGLALTHPLHFWLGRLAIAPGVGEPAFAITLVSAVAGALAVANVYGCVITLVGDRRAAALAAAFLAVANTFWQMATRAETYTLTAAVFSGEIWCLILFALSVHWEPASPARGSIRHRGRVYLWGAFFLNGLGLANHLLALLTTPVVMAMAVYALARKRARTGDVGIGVLLWMVGSLPYTGLVAVALWRGGDVGGTLLEALFGRSFADEATSLRMSFRSLGSSAAFVALNFPNVLLPLAVYGIIRGRGRTVPPPAHWALIAAFFTHFLFSIRYDVIDQHTFFIPWYVVLAVFGGAGVVTARVRLRHQRQRVLVFLAWITLFWTPVVYTFVPALARRWQVLGDLERNKPYRDDYVYLFAPWSVVERSAERVSAKAVELAQPNGLIIVEDSMAEPAIRYQVLRAGVNVTVTGDVLPEQVRRALDANRPVVLVPANADQPRSRPPVGRWAPTGDLYVLAL